MTTTSAPTVTPAQLAGLRWVEAVSNALPTTNRPSGFYDWPRRDVRKRLIDKELIIRTEAWQGGARLAPYALTEAGRTTLIAAAAGIDPATRTFVLRDEDGRAYNGGRTSHVLAALARSDKTPDLDQRTRLCAIALQKCYATSRMTPALSVRMTADYTPYQVCEVLAKIVARYQGKPTIGDLADNWINAHADEL